MAEGTSGDARSGDRPKRSPDRRRAPAAGEQPRRRRTEGATGPRPTSEAPRRSKRSRGVAPGTIPPPTIHADEMVAGRLGLFAELASAFRRDPRSFGLAILYHFGPLLLWLVFFCVAFMFTLAVYNYVTEDGDPSLEFGWLSEEEVRASRQPDGPVRLDGFPVAQPRERGSNEGEADPVDGEAGGGGGETEAKPVDVAGLLDERREWELAIEAVGGNDKTKAAINRGLAWLSRQQHADGHWQFDDPALYPDGSDWADWKTHTGATAMALMAYLGAGHTQRGGLHQKTVEKGLDWLIGRQKRRGEDAGDFFDHDDYGRAPHFFAHSMATIAICEAYALTRDEKLREPAERAVDFLVRSQHPSKGGWGYQPLRDEEAEAHLWVTGWGLMAMFTARSAGIEIDQQAFQRTSRFIDSVMAEEGAGYRNRSHPGDPTPHTLLAEGLLSRQYLGWERDHPALLNGLVVLKDESNHPAWQPGRRDLYAWYHEAEVRHNMGGEDFETWYAHVQQLIVDAQQDGPRNAPNDVNGSWHPTNPRGPVFEIRDDKLGRLYTTAMCLLILESPFRHMPVYPPEG